MDKGEPALAPQWHKAYSGNGHSNHHTAPFSHLDDLGTGHSSRNRLLLNSGDHDSSRSSSYSDKSLPSSRRSTNNNGSLNQDKERTGHSRAYNSFGRTHRDRDRDKDQDRRERDRSLFADDGFHDSFGSLTVSRNDTLRRSRSLTSGKRVESWPRRSGSDLSNGNLPGINEVNISKTSFEKDFPSLGVEDKQGPPEIARMSSPVFSTSVQNFPVNGWTSALVASGAIQGCVPAVSSTTQNTNASAQPRTPGSSGSMASLNMAETLAQAPLKVRTEPQLFSATQIKEEFARRLCVKLVPLTPVQKNSVLEKSKPKGTRGEVAIPSKFGQQPSQMMINAVRGPSKLDASKPFAGNLKILNREKNGISSTIKDTQSVSASSIANLFGVASTVNVPLKTPINMNPKVDSRGTVLPSSLINSGEKRPHSQAQNRTDFFNSLRKKSPMNSSNAPSDPSCLSFRLREEKSVEMTGLPASADTEKEGYTSPLIVECPSDNGDGDIGNGDGDTGGSDSSEPPLSFISESEEQITNSSPCLDPDEEAALLNTLGYEGWEKNGAFDPLTREEIDSFAKKCKQLEPSSKFYTRVLRVLQLLNISL